MPDSGARVSARSEKLVPQGVPPLRVSQLEKSVKETHTPIRNLRVSDEVWNAAKAGAAEEGTTVSAVINEMLRERYGDGS